MEKIMKLPRNAEMDIMKNFSAKSKIEIAGQADKLIKIERKKEPIMAFIMKITARYMEADLIPLSSFTISKNLEGFPIWE